MKIVNIVKALNCDLYARTIRGNRLGKGPDLSAQG
jgi:hypothetical protein